MIAGNSSFHIHDFFREIFSFLVATVLFFFFSTAAFPKVSSTNGNQLNLVALFWRKWYTMVQLGPVDLCVYRATNMLTSKIFKVSFCARKRDVEKCVWSLGDWLCQLDELTLVPEQRSFPSCGACTRRGILWHFYLSWFLGDFWVFWVFFSLCLCLNGNERWGRSGSCRGI